MERDDDPTVENVEEPDGSFTAEVFSSSLDNHKAVIAEAFVTLKQNQPSVPKEGYPFPKQDQVVTVLDRKPRWPCRACGSANHWDRECPHYNLFAQLWNKSAKSVYRGTDRPPDIENVYRSAYSTLLMQMVSQLYSCPHPSENQTMIKESLLISSSIEGKRGPPCSGIGYESKTVSIEEVEDEYWQQHRETAKAPEGILLMEIVPKPEESMETPAGRTEGGGHSSDAKTVRLTPRCARPPGRAAEGVSVVSVKGTVGSKMGDMLDLQLDSGADVTLISEELYLSLKNPPRMRQGMKLKLYQLTDTNAQLKGYVRIPIFMTTHRGDILETTAEAYVVPRMTVPILLGEDYQQAYELTVSRHLEKGTTVQFGGTPHIISASSVERSGDFDRLRPSTYLVTSFVKAKLHRINKRKKRERRRKTA